MLVNDICNYTYSEKLDLVNNYIDFMSVGDCRSDLVDFYTELLKNKRQLGRFLKYTVPEVFLDLNYSAILGDTLELVQESCSRIASEFPTFYIQCALVGALHCYGENLGVKKIVSRGSQILLGIF